MSEWWKIVKARKEHKCIICRKTIEVGQLYTNYTKYENGFITVKMHVACEEKFDDYMIKLYEKIERVEGYCEK
jgi:hypothetical protein